MVKFISIWSSSYFQYEILFKKTELQFIYNVLFSGVQQSDSVYTHIYTYIYIFFQILFPYSLL